MIATTPRATPDPIEEKSIKLGGTRPPKVMTAEKLFPHPGIGGYLSVQYGLGDPRFFI
jgi:hypothetical protein